MLKIALHQFNPLIGDFEYNVDQIIKSVAIAKQSGANVLVSSELAICGYPPEDLLLRDDFIQNSDEALAKLLELREILLLVGAPYLKNGQLYNAAYAIYNGEILGIYAKRALPNYGVFDEKRYFVSGTEPMTIQFNGYKLQLAICEDIWQAEIGLANIDESAFDVLVTLNASPYTETKYQQRMNLLSTLAQKYNKPIVYVNQLGGIDELVFDGGSCVMTADGLATTPLFFQDNLSYYELAATPTVVKIEYNQIANIYDALKLAISDYVHKNGFSGVVLGLSGGIDSALVLALCVDSLGADNVTAIMMPTKYTQDISIIDSRDMVSRLGVAHYQEYVISDLYNSYLECFDKLMGKTTVDTTEENIQARIRGNILMAVSNKKKLLVVTTGNKSEMTTGYATLYGDMAGGFALLKDVLKTTVYKLAVYRNTISEVIPLRIITRPPSAELAEGQFDQQSLPDYDVLDGIIKILVEQRLSTAAAIDLGYKSADVLRVARLLKINEYKRKQAAVGPKISEVAFARDWRMPNTSKFNF